MKKGFYYNIQLVKILSTKIWVKSLVVEVKMLL